MATSHNKNPYFVKFCNKSIIINFITKKAVTFQKIHRTKGTLTYFTKLHSKIYYLHYIKANIFRIVECYPYNSATLSKDSYKGSILPYNFLYLW